MTENAELVSEAAPPLDRDKLEALQFSSNYIFNQIFFSFPQPSRCKSARGFLSPRWKGWVSQGCIFNISSRGTSLLWLWMEEMPRQGWTRL